MSGIVDSILMLTTVLLFTACVFLVMYARYLYAHVMDFGNTALDYKRAFNKTVDILNEEWFTNGDHDGKIRRMIVKIEKLRP